MFAWLSRFFRYRRATSPQLRRRWFYDLWTANLNRRVVRGCQQMIQQIEILKTALTLDSSP